MALTEEAEALVNRQQYWKAQSLLIGEKARATDESQKQQIDAMIADVFQHIRKQTETSTAPAKIQFGTSGWRAIIGEDYTVRNVKRVTQAVANMMQTEEFLKETGVQSFDEVRARGGLIGFDSRFMGPEFAKAVAAVLAGNGIKIYYAGMATTPELSAAIVELDCAFSVNLTPSHNPFEWAGYKFNPDDGGPAGPNLTTLIEQLAAELMQTDAVRENADFSWITIDPIALYRQFLMRKNRVVDLQRLVAQINGTDIFLAFDNVHGATRDRMQRLLEGVVPSKVAFLRTSEDYLFGGIKPEPSSSNMKQVTDLLQGKESTFRVGAIMDPDGDRVRLTDGVQEIEMNYFGAMVLYYLYKVKGVRGVLAKSVATSNFANAVAEKLEIPVAETAVGFKEFRPYLKEGADRKAIVAFEESDGITIGDHTLEKDALIGALLGISMVLDMKKNLGEILAEVTAFAGAYYPGRGGTEVDRSLTGAPLREKLRLLTRYTTGSAVRVGGREKTVKDVLTLDGYKLVFDDNSWLLIRPSGTEPKVRFYVEGRTEDEKEQLIETARQLLQECLNS